MLRGLFTRRYFVSCLGGTAVAWPIAARAEQATMRTPCFLASRVSPLIAACKSFASVGR
jgi:hypothetical protein